MRESDIEGVASHDGPETDAGPRERVGEARTGVHAGRDIEPRNHTDWGADVVHTDGRQHGQERYGELLADPARSKTPSMRGVSVRENREIPWPSALGGEDGTQREGQGRKPKMNGQGKSDRPIVLTKPPNKAGQQTAAEVVEGRGLAEGNAEQQNTLRTQCRAGVPSALDRVREVARKDKKPKFTALFHHLTIDRLRAAFTALQRKAAAGGGGGGRGEVGAVRSQPGGKPSRFARATASKGVPSEAVTKGVHSEGGASATTCSGVTSKVARGSCFPNRRCPMRRYEVMREQALGSPMP